MNKTPAVRFIGFAEDWEQRKLGDLLQTLPFKQFLKEPEPDGKYEIIQQGNEPVIGFANGTPCGDYKDVVIFGDHTLSLYKPQHPFFVATDGVRIVKGQQDTDGYYLLSLLERYKPQSEGYKRYYSILADTNCITTYNTSEQEKIGVFFKLLDNLITLHQRKYDKLTNVKKSMLEKMFPKNGSNVPEIRFKGFTDAWKQRKLGDVADVTKLAGFEFTEHVVYSDEGNIIALRGLNIKNGQLILDDVKYIDGSNFSKLSRSKLFIDDIMFTYVGTVGEVAIIEENDRFYLAPNVSRIRVKSDDSPKFISHYMRTDNFKNKIIFPLIATSSQPALSMENIRKFTINIPINKEEQDCLAKYFDSLDHLITLHHRKLEKLEQIKQAMLHKMFV